MRYFTIISMLCLLVALPSFAETSATTGTAPEAAVAASTSASGAPESGDVEADSELTGQVFKDFDALANHFKCYSVQPLFGQVYPPVALRDQFKASEASVLRPAYLCNPVKKNNTGIIDESLHYVCFNIQQEVDPALPDVKTSNQFGTQWLRPIQSELLCLPSKKEHI